MAVDFGRAPTFPPFLRGQASDPIEVPLNALVAKRVIELAQTGERNPITLALLAVQGFTDNIR
jgi:hypothetical protein